jgi:hypothetical protein
MMNGIGKFMFYQMDETEDLIKVTKGQPIAVGDIQPGHSRVMHLWSRADRADFHFDKAKKWLHVSADELDVVRFRFPMPTYLSTKIQNQVLAAFVFLLVAFFIGWFLMGTLLPK